MASVTPAKRSRTMSMAPAASIRDEISMANPTGFRVKKGGVRERNGNTYQKITSSANSKRYRVTMNDVTNLIAPLYKYRYDGYGWNNALTDTNAEASGSLAYSTATGVTTYSYDHLYKCKGNWRSCEWDAGMQYWFETTALPFYKKIPDGSTCSLAELIKKYSDVSTNNAFTANLNIQAYYKALDSALNEGGANIQNPLINAVNICYHGGVQKHTFTNFGTTSVTMELWELHPRRYMAGYSVVGTSTAGTNRYKHEKIYEDLIRDVQDSAPSTVGANPPYDDKKNVDEIHDIGMRINNDCRRLMFKYNVSKPMKVTLAPGGTFTYELKIPAFKVTGGEFLEYLTRYGQVFDTVPSTLTGEELREAQRPSWIPKFTRILCGRMIGQKGFGISSAATKPDGNNLDTHWISAVGYGAGRVGHTKSEYHEMNLMPYMKPSTYSSVNYLDKTGITNYIDGGDDEEIVPNYGTTSQNNNRNTENQDFGNPNDDQALQT